MGIFFINLFIKHMSFLIENHVSFVSILFEIINITLDWLTIFLFFLQINHKQNLYKRFLNFLNLLDHFYIILYLFVQPNHSFTWCTSYQPAGQTGQSAFPSIIYMKLWILYKLVLHYMINETTWHSDWRA